MQSKQNSLVPIREAFGGLDGPVKEIREATPQALHHFTQADQVNQLVSASEADPELGFMARLLALCSLPRTDPKQRLQYVRHNGPYSLHMTATGSAKLPYGNIPRLLLAWVCTEAVRTQSRAAGLGCIDIRVQCGNSDSIVVAVPVYDACELRWIGCSTSSPGRS